jgi:BirA family biotin operon repressor/biotin-[acetyl-CoA-carboxylase] ligase
MWEMRRIERYACVDSTMTIAAKLASKGCPSGTIVVADEQTAGIGRHGRTWTSEKGVGLYASIVLRLPVEASVLPVVMLALGLATQEAIAQVSSLAPDLRWPNDVLLDGRKCAGILAQLEGDAIIAGIGINVAQTSFPSDLATPATSLLLAGASVNREDLLAALADAVDRACGSLCSDGAPAILRMFEASSSYTRGRRARVDQPAGTIEGVTQGLDPSGFLIIEQDDGKRITIYTGGVRSA